MRGRLSISGPGPSLSSEREGVGASGWEGMGRCLESLYQKQFPLETPSHQPGSGPPLLPKSLPFRRERFNRILRKGLSSESGVTDGVGVRATLNTEDDGTVLPGLVVQWVERPSAHPRVSGSMSSKDTYLGCRLDLRSS